jgi:hypothetical protein
MSTPRPADSVPTVPFRQPAINGFLASILRSRFHGMASKTNLLISYRGRRTGLVHELPVRFAIGADGYVVRIGRPEAKRWWRNFTEPWPLTVIVQGRSIAAMGHVVVGERDEGTDLAAAYFTRYRGSARHQGLRIRKGEQAEREDVRRAATGLLFLSVIPDREDADPVTVSPSRSHGREGSNDGG